MKNNKRSNFLSIFGILILSLGIAIACSTTGEGDVASEIDILEDIVLEQFKGNFVSTYTAEATLTMAFNGKNLVFDNNGRIATSASVDDPLYLDISVNGATGASEIFRIRFREGENDHPPYTQSVVAVTATNVFLENPVITEVGGNIVHGGNIIELIINPDTGALTFGGTKIATKN